MEGRIVEPQGQMGSLQNSRYLNHREHGYTGSSRAMAGERLAGPADNFSYAERGWTPINTSSTPITQTYFRQNQYSLPYERIINTNTKGNSSGIAINMAYVKQLYSQGVMGNGLGERPVSPQDHRDIGEMGEPIDSITNSNNCYTSMSLRDLQQQLRDQGIGGAWYTVPGFRNSDILEAALTINTQMVIHFKTLIWALIVLYMLCLYALSKAPSHLQLQLQKKKNMGFTVKEERKMVAESYHMFVCSEANDRLTNTQWKQVYILMFVFVYRDTTLSYRPTVSIVIILETLALVGT